MSATEFNGVKIDTPLECLNNNNKSKSYHYVRNGFHKYFLMLLIPLLICIFTSLVIMISLLYHINQTNTHENVPATSASQTKPVCLTQGCVKAAAHIIDRINTKVSPCNDFYEYACGSWIRRKHINDDQTGITEFGILRDQLNRQLRNILDKKAKKDETSFIKTMRNFYMQCMDTTKIEETGDLPLQKFIEKFGGWPLILQNIEKQWDESKFDWIETLVNFRNAGFSHNILMSIFISPDVKNSHKHKIYLDQASLGVPNRKYLLRGLNDSVVKAYRKTIIESAKLLGAKNQPKLEQHVDEIIKFETKLAEFSLPNEKRRNYTELYHKMTLQQISQTIPNIKWINIFKRLISSTIESEEEVIVKVPNYLNNLESLLANTEKRIIANYLIWRVVFSSMSYLSQKWRSLAEQYDRVLSGRNAERPRWDVCVNRVATYFGSALSSMYVKSHFDEESQQKAFIMVEKIREQFLINLNQVTWMDNETRRKAIKKAKEMTAQVGYAKEILDDKKLATLYEGLNLAGETYLENVQILREYYINKEIEKLKEIYVKNDWKRFSKPATINAFYSSLDNNIKFPAGILQGIFYNKDRPDYLNYGGIGYIIGHEITHGFDDRGRQFDVNGNNINWWQPETDEKFKEKARCIIEQYENYTLPEINQHINGINTQGENIADNGGLKHAFLAYQDQIKETGEELQLPSINLTPNQLFFVSAAHIWCAKMRTQSLKLKVQTGVHSPPKHRVIGPMVNMPHFADAFGCPLGSPMNPIHKCAIW